MSRRKEPQESVTTEKLAELVVEKLAALPEEEKAKLREQLLWRKLEE